MTRKYLLNDSTLKEKRLKLRKNQTFAESRMWSKLRSKRLGGIKFFRQYSVGNYILDFYSPQIKLAVEIDGGQHNDITVKKYDSKRTNFLSEQGIKLIRFWNNEVIESIEEVLEVIYKEISNPS